MRISPLAYLLFCFLGIHCATKPSVDKNTLPLWNEQMVQLANQIKNQIESPNIPDTLFNVSSFTDLSRTDQKVDIRPGIMAAITAASESGGGQVYVPPGDWLCHGPIHLESNIDLHFAAGCVLTFSDQAEDYTPLVKVRWEGTVCWNYSPLIYGYQLHDISITGSGTLDGNGQIWSPSWRKNQKNDQRRLRQMGNDLIPEDQRIFGNGYLDLNSDGKDDGYGDGQHHWLRPTFIELYECKRIRIADMTLKHSPFWNMHPVFSHDIRIKGVRIEGGYLNDDGIDPDGCEDVWISDCHIATEDDAIAIKAGRDQDAWNRMGSRRVLIENCYLGSGVNAITIGSEMSGGVQDVVVRNCKIPKANQAFTFKSNLDRGGEVSHIYMDSITIDSILNRMMVFRMDYHGYRGNQYPTQFHSFFASNWTCEYVKERAFHWVGVLEEPIRHIYLNRIYVEQTPEIAKIEFTDSIFLSQVQVNGLPFTL